MGNSHRCSGHALTLSKSPVSKLRSSVKDAMLFSYLSANMDSHPSGREFRILQYRYLRRVEALAAVTRLHRPQPSYLHRFRSHSHSKPGGRHGVLESVERGACQGSNSAHAEFLEELCGVPCSIESVSVDTRGIHRTQCSHHTQRLYNPSELDSFDSFPGNPRVQTYSAYIDYLKYLRQQYYERITTNERSLIQYRDFLQSPLQPLMDNLESVVYETFERDGPKYLHYQYAIERAIHDLNPDATNQFIIIVVGAGRGPLIHAALVARYAGQS